jgi:hypothetical protein
VADVSRAILNVTEGNEMTKIENHWFQNLSACTSQNSNPQSSSLSFRSFAGLFIITGVVSVLMLLIFMVRYTCRRWDRIKETWKSGNSVPEKFRAISKQFDRMDSSVCPVYNEQNRDSINTTDGHDVSLPPVLESNARFSHESSPMVSPSTREGSPVQSENHNLTGQGSGGQAIEMEMMTEGR